MSNLLGTERIWPVWSRRAEQDLVLPERALDCLGVAEADLAPQFGSEINSIGPLQ